MVGDLGSKTMKLRALIIDDSEMVRQLLKQLLRFTNLAEWEFSEAGDGAAALGKFSPQSVDIVFVDWNMPKMSGTEFIRKVRTGGKADHVPMIMVTGRNTVGDLETALDEFGADAYITKPFSAETLISNLREPLERIAAYREQRAKGKGPLFERLFRPGHGRE